MSKSSKSNFVLHSYAACCTFIFLHSLCVPILLHLMFNMYSNLVPTSPNSADLSPATAKTLHVNCSFLCLICTLYVPNYVMLDVLIPGFT